MKRRKQTAADYLEEMDRRTEARALAAKEAAARYERENPVVDELKPTVMRWLNAREKLSRMKREGDAAPLLLEMHGRTVEQLREELSRECDERGSFRVPLGSHGWCIGIMRIENEGEEL